MVSGSDDYRAPRRVVHVWDVGSGAEEATLKGHTGAVRASVVCGERLMSAGEDGKICIWAVGTWELLLTVLAYSDASDQYIRSMAVSGSKLVTASTSIEYGGRCEVRVWGLESLECEHTLRQPARADVFCLLGMSGEVWGGVGREVVVWGRE